MGEDIFFNERIFKIKSIGNSLDQGEFLVFSPSNYLLEMLYIGVQRCTFDFALVKENKTFFSGILKLFEPNRVLFFFPGQILPDAGVFRELFC